ncbi:hypothetical protein DFH08DRAFT_855739, partial [Mycena albidolilacea]
MGPGPGLCLLLLRTSPLALPLYPEVLIVRHPSARLDRRIICTAHTRHRPDTRAANKRTNCDECRMQLRWLYCPTRARTNERTDPITAEALRTARTDCCRGTLRTET